MSRRAWIVADLGFGDSGKGTVTDFLVRHHQAGLVVRYNGGAQAGHTVVLPDGRAHTFSQLGAGSFVPGVRTHLSRFMVIHPGGLLREAEALAGLGVTDSLERTSIHPEALVITPFQQAANRLREWLRGEARHGSCGLGFGETVQDSLEHPLECVRAGDLAHPQRLRTKLVRLQQRKWEQFSGQRRGLRGHPEWELLESATAAERWIEQAGAVAAQVSLTTAPLPDRGAVVFEGAQGVLLDEWRGFHPHTTWSTCTFANALELLQDWGGEVCRLGVVRAYATRHGAGPFPTEDPALAWPEPHNHHGPWQGEFRLGHFDAVLTRYALECCGGVDGLALTHLDRVQKAWPLALAYDNIGQPFYDRGRLQLGAHQDLDYQERLGRALLSCRPRYRTVAADGLIARLEELLEAPVLLQSHGPHWSDKRLYSVPLCAGPK